MPVRAFISGAWRDISDVRVFASGQWRRVQEARQFIAGQWRNVYNYDITGPGTVRNVTAQWSNSSGPACVVSWQQPADADLAYVDLYVNRDGSNSGPWTYVGRYSGNSATTYSVVDSTVTLSNYFVHGPNQASSVHYYYFVPFDQRGNQGTGLVKGSTGQNSVVVRGYVTSPYYTNSTFSRTWRGSAWRTDGIVTDSTSQVERVVQGSSSSGENLGYYFYGNGHQQGLNPSSADFYLARQNGGIGSGVAPYMRASVVDTSFPFLNANPTGQTSSGLVIGTALATPNNGGTRSGWMGIPIDWTTGMGDGTFKSVFLYTGEAATTGSTLSTNYAVWSSRNEDVGFGVGPGTLRVYHSG